MLPSEFSPEGAYSGMISQKYSPNQAGGRVLTAPRLPSRLLRFFAVIALCCFAASAQAANTRMTAIALFDGSDGPAYVQISGVTVNGKTELRLCDGVTKIEKRNYDLLFKTQLAGASSLERGADGVFKLTVNSKPLCVVPASLKFDKKSELTPAEAADQAVLQGLVVSSSTQGLGLPVFKPGVRLVFVAAPDDELAAYLSADRAHSISAWQAFVMRYGSSTRAADAKNAMAAIYEESAALVFAEYRRSATHGDLTRLKQAQQQADEAEKSVIGYAPARRVKEQINKELDALLESDRNGLQNFRKALTEHTAGYAQLASAKQHTEQVLEINSQYASASNLHAEIVGEQRKLASAVQSAEALLPAKRYDEAMAALGPYRSFASELPRIDAVMSAVYTVHFVRGQEYGKTQAWDQASSEFRKALDVRGDSKEAAAALKNAELQANAASNKRAAQGAVVQSRNYAEKGEYVEAYEILANLPDAQQPYVTDQLVALQRNYVTAAFKRAQKLQEIHVPIRGRADEDAVRQAYDLLERATSLSGDPAMKLKRDLLSDKISAYYVEQAQKYLGKPMGSGVGLGWLYLGEAERYKPNMGVVREAMARYASAYQLRSRLSVGVVLRDQSSRRDNLGFADQLRDAIANSLESSGLPIKALRQFNESDPVQPNFAVVAEILEHRVLKNTNLETLQSKYRAGTHEVKNPAWLQANQDYDAAQQQLSAAQRAAADAQSQHKKKEIILAVNDSVAAAQKHAAEARHTLETIEQTRPENVIEPYNYMKKNIDLTAVIEMTFRIKDQSGNAIETPVSIKKDDHQVVVVLENVKPEDTEGVRKQSTEPDQAQFLTDLEIQARDALIKSVREKVLLLPGKILAEARRRAQTGDLDGAAEEYALYMNAVNSDGSQGREEATNFLHDHYNVTVGARGNTAESRLRAMR